LPYREYISAVLECKETKSSCLIFKRLQPQYDYKSSMNGCSQVDAHPIFLTGVELNLLAG